MAIRSCLTFSMAYCQSYICSNQLSLSVHHSRTFFSYWHSSVTQAAKYSCYVHY